MAAQDVYDFETIVPRAVKTVMDANPAGAANTLTVLTIEAAPDFQKKRPRVEITYKHMGEATPKRIVTLPDGTKRTAAFRGELRLHAITDADEPGKFVHSIYRAEVRNTIAALQDNLFAVSEALPLHKIVYVVAGTEETGVRTQDGFQQTTFPFQIDILITQEAWKSL